MIISSSGSAPSLSTRASWAWLRSSISHIGACLLCLPSDTVQNLVQEQTLWYFPHLCPAWLAPVSMPVTGSSLSLSSLFKKKTLRTKRSKLYTGLSWSAPLPEEMSRSGSRERFLPRRLMVCVSQRTRVHYRSPPVVCCGCRFVASSAVAHTIRLKTCWEERRSDTQKRGGGRLEQEGQCSLRPLGSLNTSDKDESMGCVIPTREAERTFSRQTVPWKISFFKNVQGWSKKRMISKRRDAPDRQDDLMLLWWGVCKSQGDWSGHIEASGVAFKSFLILLQTRTPLFFTVSPSADQASSPTGGKTGIDKEKGWGGPEGLQACSYLTFIDFWMKQTQADRARENVTHPNDFFIKQSDYQRRTGGSGGVFLMPEKSNPVVGASQIILTSDL